MPSTDAETIYKYKIRELCGQLRGRLDPYHYLDFKKRCCTTFGGISWQHLRDKVLTIKLDHKARLSPAQLNAWAGLFQEYGLSYTGPQLLNQKTEKACQSKEK